MSTCCLSLKCNSCNGYTRISNSDLFKPLLFKRFIETLHKFMKSILIHMIFSAAISDYIIVCFVLLDHVVCISVTHINTP